MTWLREYVPGVLIVLCIICLFYLRESWRGEYLRGFWVAEDDDFCYEAGIESMFLYIGKDMGYLVVPDLYCGPAKITPSIGWFSALFGDYTVGASIELDEPDIMPDRARLIVEPAKCSLTITDADGTVYAKLHKQNY